MHAPTVSSSHTRNNCITANTLFIGVVILSLGIQRLLVDSEFFADRGLLALSDTGDDHVDTEQHTRGLYGALEYLSLNCIGVEDLFFHGVAYFTGFAVQSCIHITSGMERGQFGDHTHWISAAILRQSLGNDLKCLSGGTVRPPLEPGLAVEFGVKAARNLDFRGSSSRKQLAF
ncbi:S-layer protein, putative [Babesia ovata]|uniref:S-layer protein, putative n=1 Tax=Babesia ovata TaxID=189622 RepID=A0A2H6K8T6_9APIC|nr:S-layer protein, putative [Babesia ovata]GBE59407.1 S-layer protein, putative [Babesia ovata]